MSVTVRLRGLEETARLDAETREAWNETAILVIRPPKPRTTLDAAERQHDRGKP